MATKHDLTIEQGATLQLTLTIYDEAGSAMDLSNYTGRMHGRLKVASTTTFFEWDSDEITCNADGTIDIVVSATDTAALDFTRGVYDLEIESDGGVVTRIIEGTVTLSKEVTR